MTHLLLMVLLAAPARKRESIVPPAQRHATPRAQAPAAQAPAAQAPAAQVPLPAPSPSAARSPTPQREQEATPLVLDAQFGVAALHRQLTTVDDLFGRFYPHTQPIAAALALQLRYFPIAHVTAAAVSGLGLYGHGSWAPALASRLPDNTRLAVSHFDLGAGVVFRYVLGPVEMAAALGAVVQAWLFSPSPEGTLSLTYVALKPALDARFNLATHLALLLGGDIRVPLRTPAAQFPRATALGFRLVAGAAIPLLAGLEIRVTGEYLRYGLDMHSQPGDSAVLGGLVDQSYGGTLAVAYRL